MIPAAFDYIVPDSLEGAAASLAEAGDDAKVMAGGHSLLPMMKLRLAQPSVVIDLKRLDSLRQIQLDGGALRIGALVTHHQVETSGEVADNCPLLAMTAGSIGDPQVRNRGTIGGSVVHGDPAADWPAALLALGVGDDLAVSYALVVHLVALWLPVNLLGLAMMWRQHLSLRQLVATPPVPTVAREPGFAGGSTQTQTRTQTREGRP